RSNPCCMDRAWSARVSMPRGLTSRSLQAGRVSMQPKQGSLLPWRRTRSSQVWPPMRLRAQRKSGLDRHLSHDDGPAQDKLASGIHILVRRRAPPVQARRTKTRPLPRDRNEMSESNRVRIAHSTFRKGPDFFYSRERRDRRAQCIRRSAETWIPLIGPRRGAGGKGAPALACRSGRLKRCSDRQLAVFPKPFPASKTAAFVRVGSAAFPPTMEGLDWLRLRPKFSRHWPMLLRWRRSGAARCG